MTNSDLPMGIHSVEDEGHLERDGRILRAMEDSLDMRTSSRDSVEAVDKLVDSHSISGISSEGEQQDEDQISGHKTSKMRK